MARLAIPRSFNYQRNETHERFGGEGGFQTRPYESCLFFAPFALPINTPNPKRAGRDRPLHGVRCGEELFPYCLPLCRARLRSFDGSASMAYIRG